MSWPACQDQGASEACSITVSRPPGAYFPFAAGPRACLGAPLAMLEAQLIVAQVIQAYDVALVAGQQVVPQPRLTLRPRHGVPMVVCAWPAAAAGEGALWT